MGKACTKYILGLLWKIVENIFFLNSEHIGMRGKCSPCKKITISIHWVGRKFHPNPPWRIFLANRYVHYRNSDLILCQQHNFTWVIILTILVCIMHKYINHPISYFILPCSAIIFLQWRRINIINKSTGNIWLILK